MFKQAIALAAALAALNANALTTGDLAFTSFNADEDGWSMVALTDIAANTTIYFSDNEWNGSAIGSGGAFNANESYSKWLSGASSVTAGTVIRFLSTDSATLLSSSIGSFSRETVASNTNWGMGNSNETLYAYVGTSATAPTAFLAAITNSDFGSTDGTLAGTGLVQGVTANRLNNANPTTSPDYGAYNGARSGLSSFAAYLPLLNAPSNWTVDTTNGVYTTTVPNTTAFSIVATPAVPEPESHALALVSLGLFGGLLARRRSAR